MQIKSLLSLIIIMFIPFLMRAEWIPLNKQNTSPAPPNVTLISDDDNSTVLKIEISGFDQNNFITDGKTYQKIDLLTESFTNSPGAPELPYIAKVLAIPDQAGISVEVLETGNMLTFSNIYLPPSRQSWFEGSPEKPCTENSEAFNSMSAYPSEFVQFEPPSVFRDFRITRISVFPLLYIPSKKELQVVSSITVRINYGPGEVVNPKTTAKKPIAPSFGKLYSQLIFNYQSVLNKNYGGKKSGHELMLCIMPDEFVASFQTYADWKRQSGIDIHITKFTDIGANSTNPVIIKNHITDAYHNWVVPPTYVLIVGDNNVFPKQTVTLDGWTFPNEDYFVEIDGNDYFPELMIGRFTNESDYGMQVMINKFLKYEKTPYTTNTDWFKKGICCSNNAYPSQAETKRFAADIMLQAGAFTSVDTMMSKSPCIYGVTDVVAAINSGRSWLNYRGEGWYYGWTASCTPLDISDLTSINNGQKFTFVTSIGCGVAMFDETSTTTHNSFGEDWIEMGTLSSPKGAVAFIGPTSNTHTAYNNNIDRGIYIGMFQEGLETPGQALLRGKLYMYNVFGNDYYTGYHYKIYCVLGDPSIHIWKDVPKAVTVTYPTSIPFGNNLVEFTVTHTATGLPVSNAEVCVSGTTIFATGTTNATGKAYLDLFSEVQETLKVTVRGGNVIPFLGTLSVVQPTGPYVIRETYTLNDASGGNGNGLMDFGEFIQMSLTVKNVGTLVANNVNVTLSTTDPNITFTDNFHNYGNIAAGQAITATNAYAFNTANNLPDEHVAGITVTAVSGINTWISNITVAGHAPVLSMGTVTISDPSGNNNGRLDPSETATLTFEVSNSGHSLSPIATANLSCASPYITINSGASALGQIAASNSANAVFSITCSPSTPIGQSVDFGLNVSAGSYGFSSTFNTPIGLVLEDWELGNFTRFPWTLSGNTNWAVVSAGQYEGNYTAISGAIEDNQTSSLSLTMQVNAAAPVSFYRKTSTETNYDFLRFYIDDVLQGQWSGSIDWGMVSYPVTTGVHNFKWTYLKDYSVSSGSDCVWVDYIIFPPSTIIAPEITLSQTSFSKNLLPAVTTSDALIIGNTGTIALGFNAFVDIDTLQTIVYPQAVNYWTGSCTSTTKTYPSAVRAISPSEAGWMKFDVSNIPVGSTIISVELNGYIYNNDIPYWSVTPVTLDPVTANASVLYPDIVEEANSGYYLFRNETISFTINQWYSFMLGGNVNTNLSAALSQGWFAMGFAERHTSGTFNIRFNGCTSSYRPYLVIKYSIDSVPNWLKINGGTSVTGNIAIGANQNITVGFEAGSYPVGTYSDNIIIQSNDPDESLISIPCTMIISSGLNVSLKAVLEGPFNVSAMGTGINTILPLSQPYNAAPWNYTGTESVAAMPATVVDWVLVELRDANSAANATLATRIARKAGLLLTNGNIVATDGASPLFFTNSVSNGLFVVIYHRNHLAILSSNALTQAGGVYTYDYTTSSGQAYGASSQKQLATGIWGMISGDVNANGTIGNEDITPLWKSNAGKTGYYPADLNFDRHVNNRDKDNYWYPNNGKGTNVPQ
jgi:hypothetical protein